MTGFSEGASLQPAVVERLASLGWTHWSAKDLPRAIDAVFVEAHLVEALLRLNHTIAADPSRVDEVLPKLRAVALSAMNDGLLAANERMTTWLRGHMTHKFVG